MSNRLLAGAMSAGLALGVLGCGGPAPSPDPDPPDGPPVACLRVEANLVAGPCREFAAVAAAWLPDGGPRPVYIEVTMAECAAGMGCDRTATVIVERENAEPVALRIRRLAEGGPQVEQTDTFRFAREPSSPKLTQQTAPFDLEHCGIWSGIDVDGSFWDPVGLVAAMHPDASNGARGTFSLTSTDTAILRTEHGFVLHLVRHVGPKYLPGCD